jgi:hypothetical protein
MLGHKSIKEVAMEGFGKKWCKYVENALKMP